ncbi:MAG: LbtU family siderophore porin [Magnetococcales bacterium]|nr:LbtU family siderophore porin [Magnetococcales bacterium]
MMKKSALSSMVALLTMATVATAQADSHQSEAKWTDNITISGAVEVDAVSSSDYADVDTSDLVVSTVELAIDGTVNDWVSANVTLLYEEDDTPLDVDSASFTIANPDKSPFSLTVGSVAVPFGAYSSNLLSDPLTLSLGETVETAAILSLANDNFSASVYAFNGSSSTGDEAIEQYGLSLGYTIESGDLSLELGAGWINAIEDSDTIQDAIPTAVTAMNDHITGAAYHATLGFKGFTIIGEYVAAMDDFETKALTFNGNGARPSAWNAEVGYSFEIGERGATIAASYQNSDEALGLGLAKQTFSAGFAVDVFENTTAAFEWKVDSDYDTTDNAAVDSGVATAGTGENQNQVTLRLAVGF